MNGIQEVSGSIPLISTKEKRHIEVCVFFSLIKVLWGERLCRRRRQNAGEHKRPKAALHARRAYPAYLHQRKRTAERLSVFCLNKPFHKHQFSMLPTSSPNRRCRIFLFCNGPLCRICNFRSKQHLRKLGVYYGKGGRTSAVLQVTRHYKIGRIRRIKRIRDGSQPGTIRNTDDLSANPGCSRASLFVFVPDPAREVGRLHQMFPGVVPAPKSSKEERQCVRD